MSYPYGIIRAAAREFFWRKRLYGARSLVIPPSSEERYVARSSTLHPGAMIDQSHGTYFAFLIVRPHPRHRRCRRRRRRRRSLARLQPRIQRSIFASLRAPIHSLAAAAPSRSPAPFPAFQPRFPPSSTRAVVGSGRAVRPRSFRYPIIRQGRGR